MPRLWHGHPTREGPKCLGPANKASPMKVKRNSHQRPMNPYSMPMQSPGKLRENQEFCVGFHEGLVGPTKCQQTKPTNKPLSHCKVVLRFLGLSQTICVCVFFLNEGYYIHPRRAYDIRPFATLVSCSPHVQTRRNDPSTFQADSYHSMLHGPDQLISNDIYCPLQKNQLPSLHYCKWLQVWYWNRTT